MLPRRQFRRKKSLIWVEFYKSLRSLILVRIEIYIRALCPVVLIAQSGEKKSKI